MFSGIPGLKPVKDRAKNDPKNGEIPTLFQYLFSIGQ